MYVAEVWTVLSIDPIQHGPLSMYVKFSIGVVYPFHSNFDMSIFECNELGRMIVMTGSMAWYELMLSILFAWEQDVSYVVNLGQYSHIAWSVQWLVGAANVWINTGIHFPWKDVKWTSPISNYRSPAYSPAHLGGISKNEYELLNLIALKISKLYKKITSFNVWVRYFVWKFKGYLTS